jgi:hypothetical protein
MENEHSAAQFCLCTFVSRQRSLRTSHFVRHDMENQYFSPRFRLSILLVDSVTCEIVTLSDVTWKTNISHKGYFCLFRSVDSEACELVTSSDIIWKMNISQQGSVCLF